MTEEEQEYMDYLIHNRKQLTNQITQHLSNIIVLQKQLDIATKALRKINNPTFGDIYNELTDEINYNLLMDIAQQALKEIDEVKND